MILWKNHKAILLGWNYAIPWCQEVTSIIINFFQCQDCCVCFVLFSYQSEAKKELNPMKEIQHMWTFAAISKGKCILDSIPRFFFPLKISIGTFLITRLEYVMSTFKYSFALILLPEAISQPSSDILEPLQSFLWDWKASNQGKAKPPWDLDSQFHGKTAH